MPGTRKFDADPEAWRGASSSGASTLALATPNLTMRRRSPRAMALTAMAGASPRPCVLRLRRRPPPALPLEVFGETWKQWLLDAAAAAACPVDYVVAPLLASASTLIGNARWAQAGPGWSEPPHLWEVVVGDFRQRQIPRRRLFDARRAAHDRAANDRRLPRSSRRMAGRRRIRQTRQETLEGGVSRSAEKEKAASADTQTYGAGHSRRKSRACASTT